MKKPVKEQKPSKSIQFMKLAKYAAPYIFSYSISNLMRSSEVNMHMPMQVKMTGSYSL